MPTAPILVDYPRTLREWGRRLEANLTQDLVVKDYPSLRENADYEAFTRKWQYLFAYAGAGFAKGYITCHMLTWIREVSYFILLSAIPRRLKTLPVCSRMTRQSYVISSENVTESKIEALRAARRRFLALAISLFFPLVTPLDLAFRH